MKTEKKTAGRMCAILAAAGVFLLVGTMLIAPVTQAEAWRKNADTAGNVGQYSSSVCYNNKLYVAYYDATNTNLKIAHSNPYQYGWYVATVDNSPNDVGQYCSLAIKSDYYYISYYDLTTGHLKLATSPINDGSAWTISIVDWGTSCGAFSSIAVDNDNRIHIAYFDWSNYDLKYATKPSGGTTWSIETVDSVNKVGKFPSIAVDSSSKVHISYEYIWGDTLKYAYGSYGSWTKRTVDTTIGTGAYDSLFVDANGIYISYYDSKNTNLKFCYMSSPTATPVISTIDNSANNVGLYTSLKVTSTKKYISYYDATNGDLKSAVYFGGTWTKSVVDNINNVGQFSSCSVGNYLYMTCYDATKGDLVTYCTLL